MTTPKPVLIAGGGIGGLSTAIALAREDIEATVLERSTFTEESGAGIQLGPNATRILRALGVLDLLLPSACRPEAIWLFDGLSGRRLAEVPLGDTAERRYGAPYITLHRADLHAGLRAAADAAAPVSLTSGFDVSGIDANGELGVTDLDGTGLQWPPTPSLPSPARRPSARWCHARSFRRLSTRRSWGCGSGRARISSTIPFAPARR
jgi:salicylate hydroxylase